MSKVLFIGIDGGCLDLIKKWRDELPNFKVFLEDGVYGTLESTLPPITSPAWNCMFTGKNPGKIGLYDFYLFSFDKKDITIVNSTFQDSPSLWEILSKFDVRVGVVNVPNTYPPCEVNGLMVCGGILNVLARDVSFTYPVELKKELNEAVEGYEILPLTDLLIPGKEKEYLGEFKNVLNKQVRAVEYLMKKYPWDFFAYVIFETDSIQHYFWHHMDENHPKWNPKKSKQYEDSIKHFYKEVDKAVGKIVAQCSDDTNVIIVSDHGFGPLYGYFCVNKWLSDKGYLKTRSHTRIYYAKKKIERIPVHIRNFVLNRFGNKVLRNILLLIPQSLIQKFTFRGQRKDECKKLLDDIDWSQTKAFGLRMGIYINLEGKSPDGIVRSGKEYEGLRNEIIQSLRDIRHPDTGEKIIRQIFKKEEVYSGKYLHMAPDLIYIVDNMRYRPIEGLNYETYLVESQLSGDHRLEGMFMAYGPDIEKTGAEIQGMRIYDVTPTILHLFGIPLSKDIGGRVLKEIFAADSKFAKQPVAYEEPEKPGKKVHTVYSAQDEEVIKERLRNLGYL